METKTLTPSVQPGARLRARLLTVAQSLAELDRRDRFTDDDEIRRYNERLRARLKLNALADHIENLPAGEFNQDQPSKCVVTHGLRLFGFNPDTVHNPTAVFADEYGISYFDAEAIYWADYSKLSIGEKDQANYRVDRFEAARILRKFAAEGAIG